MGKYLPASRIKLAVKRLGTSRAQKTMVDFLILKRTFRLQEKAGVKPHDEAILSTNQNKHFADAIDDLMLSGLDAPEDWFINVFGTSEHEDAGYRFRRYTSNGTAVTVPRWSDIVEVLSRRPVKVTLASDYLVHLRDKLHTHSRAPKPRLDDAAVWFFRADDISEYENERDSWSSTIQRLTARFKGELGLTNDELELFDTSSIGDLETDEDEDSGESAVDEAIAAAAEESVSETVAPSGVHAEPVEEGVGKHE